MKVRDLLKYVLAPFRALAKWMGKEGINAYSELAGNLDISKKTVEYIKDQVAINSIDENMFIHPEMKEKVKELKEAWKHSPETVADIAQDLLKVISGWVSEMEFQNIAGFKVTKTNTPTLNNLFNLIAVITDINAFISILGIIGDAIPLIDIQNLGRELRSYIEYSGLGQYVGYGFGMILANALQDKISYETHEQQQITIPPPQDLITMLVRETFDEERMKALIEGYPAEAFEPYMKKHGYSPFWSKKYWGSHWRLPPPEQLNEMLHRGLIDRETWKKYMKYNDYIPEMIPKYEGIIYSPYTRVDTRRMYELFVIDEQEMIDNYKALGYDQEHAEKLALWSKVYTQVPNLRAIYRNGWITSDQLMQELLDLGLTQQQAQNIYKQYIKIDKPERTQNERDLTKSEIVKGVKIYFKVKKEIDDLNAYIQWMQDNNYSQEEIQSYIDYRNERKTYLNTLPMNPDLAVQMLKNMGYDESEAKYIIWVNTEVQLGSPETPAEFEYMTELDAAASGKELKKVTNDRIAYLEAETKRYRGIIRMLEKEGKEAELKKARETLAELQRQLLEERLKLTKKP